MEEPNAISDSGKVVTFEEDMKTNAENGRIAQNERRRTERLKKGTNLNTFDKLEVMAK